MKKKDYKKICGKLFFASPSRALKNAITGGCALGYRENERRCHKCKHYNTHNHLAEGWAIGARHNWEKDGKKNA